MKRVYFRVAIAFIWFLAMIVNLLSHGETSIILFYAFVGSCFVFSSYRAYKSIK